MADSSLPMAQIPSFSLGATPNNAPSVANAIQGIQGGGQQAIQAMQFQQQLAQQKQQQAIEKNMKMLETGSQMMLEGGPEVQQTGQDLIKQSYPFLTGQPLPDGMPLDKNTAKDLGWYMDQHRQWQQTNGKEGLSAQDAVTGATQAVARYGMKYQQQQMGLLEKTPMYKEATATQEPGQVNGQPANFNPQSGQPTAQGSGQPMQGNFVPNTTLATIQNEKAQSLKSTFMEASKDFQQIAPDYRDFSTLMAQPMPADPSTMSPQDKQNAVTNQKAALLKYVQLNVPASRRPPNMSSLETMAQGGELPQQAQQVYNQLFQTGTPLTGKMVNALRATATKTYLSAEAQQAQIENSWAQNAKANGVDPSTVVQNFRPSTAASSSQFFPSQGQAPLLGSVVNFKGKTMNGKKMLVGHDSHNPDNWVESE
jgi:hypothetical protein